MFGLRLDTSALDRKFRAIERRFPQLQVQVLNEAAFRTRRAWADQIATVFDRPTPLTRRAPLYRKATPANLVAEVFIRDQVSGGTPPSEYLKPEEFGGPRAQKPFERRLSRRPGGRPFYVPGRGVQLDQYGNVRPGLLRKVGAQLQAGARNETAKARGARLRRQARRGGGGSFFMLARPHGKLRPGVVYERIADLSISDAGEARATSRVRAVLLPRDSAPRYRPRFKALALARRIARSELSAIWRRLAARGLFAT